MKRLLSVLFFSAMLSCLYSQELKTISLNPPDKLRGLPVMQALEKRASANEFGGRKLTKSDLSDLLWASNGINRPEIKKRTAPSAMNSQDVDVYAFMEEGIYLYNAAGNELKPVTEGDHRNLIAGNQSGVADAPVILLLVSDISRFSSGTDSLKLTWAAMDAGIVSQNIAIFCASAGLNTRPRVGMDVGSLRKIMNLTSTQYPLLNNPVSYPVK